VSHDDDPEVSNLIPNSVATRLDEIDEIAFAEYCAHLRLDGFCVNRCSNARVNKYLVGTRMRKHCDHITTLFDPLHTYRGEKGVPVLSAVGSLNEEYEGGQFVMWDSEIIPIAKGSVLVFPSSFMFPHEVRMVTKGERLSWVSWAW
jgi:predicted 2-oxoglutarate/Fe(II)-dependent dioxygenase YbiX